MTPNDRVSYAFVSAPIVPKLFRGGWRLITRTIIPAAVTVPVGENRVTGFGDMSFEALGHKLVRDRKGQLFDVSFGGVLGFPPATGIAPRSINSSSTTSSSTTCRCFSISSASR